MVSTPVRRREVEYASDDLAYRVVTAAILAAFPAQNISGRKLNAATQAVKRLFPQIFAALDLLEACKEYHRLILAWRTTGQAPNLGELSKADDAGESSITKAGGAS